MILKNFAKIRSLFSEKNKETIASMSLIECNQQLLFLLNNNEQKISSVTLTISIKGRSVIERFSVDEDYNYLHDEFHLDLSIRSVKDSIVVETTTGLKDSNSFSIKDSALRIRKKHLFEKFSLRTEKAIYDGNPFNLYKGDNYIDLPLVDEKQIVTPVLDVV